MKPGTTEAVLDLQQVKQRYGGGFTWSAEQRTTLARRPSILSARGLMTVVSVVSVVSEFGVTVSQEGSMRKSSQHAITGKTAYNMKHI